MESPENTPNPGPEPERVKIDGDWQEAAKKALGKPKPEGGWPKAEAEAPLGGPIRLIVKEYRGSDSSKQVQFQSRLEAAATLEDFLNSRHAEDQPHTFTYGDLADETGVSKAVVKELLSASGGGSNGITI